jgi:hypothetical protein
MDPSVYVVIWHIPMKYVAFAYHGQLWLGMTNAHLQMQTCNEIFVLLCKLTRSLDSVPVVVFNGWLVSRVKASFHELSDKACLTDTSSPHDDNPMCFSDLHAVCCVGCCSLLMMSVVKRLKSVFGGNQDQ